jgi:hypothetical protein
LILKGTIRENKMAATILLYSKYSPYSKRLMELIQKSPVNFNSLYSLKLLCLDNENVRNFIINNKKIPIDFVPTVLIIFPDGIVEKYEGSHALNWAENIIARHRPPILKTPPSKFTMPQTRLEEEEEDEEEEVPVRKPSIKPKPKSKPKKRPVKKREIPEEPPENSTNIEDLGAEDYDTESEPEDEEMDEDSQSSVSSVKPGQKWEPKENWSPFGRGGGNPGRGRGRGQPPQGIRQPNGKVNVASIIAQAQAMQRQRDKIDQVPPVGQIPPRGGSRR